MTHDEMSALIGTYLHKYRAWPYPALVHAIEHTDTLGDSPSVYLERTDFLMPSGESCMLEIEALWDSDPDGDIRVMAFLFIDGGVPEFGGYTCNDSDDFIMAPDGSFIGE